MTEGDAADEGDVREHPEARTRARRTLSWIWLAPVFAAAVVLWLAWRSLAENGPAIVIDFVSAEGMQEGQTKIRYKGVDVGTVESLELSRDMSRVQVHARMTRAVAGFLGQGVRFWIVAPRVGAGGITGLSTIVSGSYIEMYPGRAGPKQRHFVGLEQPPLLQPDTPGRSFNLVATELGALIPGSQLTYHGIPVGEVEGYSLSPSRQGIELYAFVRAPYDSLVHPETRFWNESGIDVSAGATGVRLRVSSWQQFLIGGIAFDTPQDALARAPSAVGAQFKLYDSRGSADRDPRTAPLLYHVNFLRPVRGIGRGTPVELQGTDIGSVTEAHFVYDDSRQSLTTRATMAIDPSVIEIDGVREANPDRHAAEVKERIERLLARGLHARVMTSSFLTGLQMIALDVLPNAPATHRVAGSDEIPPAAAADIDEMLATAQSTLRNLQQVTAGPELGRAVKSLDATLDHLSRISADLEPQIGPLIASLRAAAQAAEEASKSAGALIGTGSRTDVDLPHLVEQLNESARAVRELADYLDRHPEALLRGRRGEAR
jgi:paraquat-inducible protein B